MTRWQYEVIRKLNAVLLRPFPTCDLQFALETRVGVVSRTLGPDEVDSFHAGGPCVVTINRD